ncbi:hypothetical protein LCGC14_1520660, partial [marine sediment metagenome]
MTTDPTALMQEIEDLVAAIGEQDFRNEAEPLSGCSEWVALKPAIAAAVSKARTDEKAEWVRAGRRQNEMWNVVYGKLEARLTALLG